MSASDLPDIAHLELLLQQITQGQNIKDNEAYFKKYLKTTHSVNSFIQIITASQNPSTRQMAAVLLRKNINKHWPEIDAQTQSQIKEILLNRLATEESGIVRINIASLVATLAQVAIVYWPELLNFIDQLNRNENLQAREIALYLLAELLEDPSIDDFLAPHMQQLMQLFTSSLTDQQSSQIRKNALRAISNHASNFSEESDTAMIVSIIPSITHVLSEAINEKDNELIVSGVQVFDNLLESGANVSLEALSPAMELTMNSLALNTQQELSIREVAMDFLENVTETKPSTLSQNPQLIQWLVQCAFTIAAECEDDPEQHTPVDMAFRFVDSLALNLPNKVIYQPLIEAANQIRQNQSPWARKASYLAIGVMSEGCADFLKQDLEAVLNILIQGLQDPHQSVREAVGLSLGYCSEHLKPEIMDFHQLILPPIINLIPNSPNNVKTKALYAIDTFCEFFDEDIEPYLPTLVPTLVNLVINDEMKIKQMALSALTSAISSAENKISPYYNDMIQLLGKILESQSEGDNPVKATALHCLGQLAAAGTAEAFQPYLQTATQVANLFLSTEVLELREAAFAFYYLLSRVLEQNIAPFSEFVLNQAMMSASNIDKAPVTIVDEEDEDDSDEEEQQRSVRTVFLDEKTAALHAIGNLLFQCPQQVTQYMANILQVLTKLWTYHHQNIRQQTVTTAQQLVEAMLKHSNKIFTDEIREVFGSQILPQYLTRIQFDYNKEVVCRVIESLEELLPQTGNQLFNENQMELLTNHLVLLLQEKSKCQEREEELAEEDKDHDQTLMGDLSDFIQALAKQYGEGFTLYFEQLLPHIGKFTEPNRNLRDRNMFTGCLADSLMYMPSLCQKYSNHIHQLVTLNLKDDTSLVRNTCYLLGVFCENLGDSAGAQYTEYLTLLYPVFQSKVDQGTLDNAVACIGRMMIGSLQSIPLNSVLPVWFQNVPLKDDFEEVKTVVKSITHLIQSGADLSIYHETILKVLFDAVITQRDDPNKYKLDYNLELQVKNVLIQYKDTDVFKQVGSLMTPECQEIISQILS